ncbi:hypothetical protein ES705_44534 [subsurface metagenome]
MYEKQRYVLGKLLRKAGIEPHTDGFFVAGGALTSVFLNTTVTDLDIFFHNQKAFDKFKRSQGRDEPIFRNNKNLVCQTDSADSYNINGIRVQLIKKLYGLPYYVIDHFDFTICMAAYVPVDNKIVLEKDFLYHLSGKELHYRIGEYPLASLWRAKKYLKKGFNFPAVEIIKLALTINNLNIKDYKGLKEQLEGIDTLFLMDLTNALLKKGDEEFELGKAIGFIEDILAKKLTMM